VAGTGWELTAITAVVGGTLLSGGQGSATGTLVGLLLLGVIYNVFNLEGTLKSYRQWELRGVFLLIVVVVQKRLIARLDPSPTVITETEWRGASPRSGARCGSGTNAPPRPPARRMCSRCGGWAH